MAQANIKNINDKTWKDFKKLCVDNCTTMSDVLLACIKNYIKKHGGSKNGIHKP